jgi:hypothetical protein
MSFVTADDLILYKEGDKIYSGGFQVNSILLKQGYPAIQRAGTSLNSGTDQVSDLFADFAVPSGLLYLPNKNTGISNENNQEVIMDDDDYVTDDIYNTLMDLASVKKGGTKKRVVRKGGTRKNRK